jgi:hypothetical protein
MSAQHGPNLKSKVSEFDVPRLNEVGFEPMHEKLGPWGYLFYPSRKAKVIWVDMGDHNGRYVRQIDPQLFQPLLHGIKSFGREPPCVDHEPSLLALKKVTIQVLQGIIGNGYFKLKDTWRYFHLMPSQMF